jgi:hypothetical protein
LEVGREGAVYSAERVLESSSAMRRVRAARMKVAVIMGVAG